MAELSTEDKANLVKTVMLDKIDVNNLVDIEFLFDDDYPDDLLATRLVFMNDKQQKIELKFGLQYNENTVLDLDFKQLAYEPELEIHI